MAQHDYNIANGDGASVRADINNVLNAIATNNSGATAPATTFAYQWWMDTTDGVLKQRNGNNTAWVVIGGLGSMAFNGELSPAQLTADVDNYDPTGLSSAAILRLTSDASRTINGLAGGYAGRILVLHNVGAQSVVLGDEITSSTEANRFALEGNVSINGGFSLAIYYDGASSRWRVWARKLQVHTQSEMEAESASSSKYPNAARMKFNPGHPKAWLHYDNQDVASIITDWGVASVSDDNVGIFTPTFDTAFDGATYMSVGMIEQDTATADGFLQKRLTSSGTYSATQYTCIAALTTSAEFDSDHNMITWFGDLP